MSFGQTLKGVILPKIPLKTISDTDSSYDAKDSAYVESKSNPSAAQETGANTPCILIGGVKLSKIETMTLDETGFLPKISITFIDEFGQFAGDYFPKSNLILSLYLKVGTDKLKPVRCDFLITKMDSVPVKYSGDSTGIGIGSTYFVKGELYIPGLYNNSSKSFPELNSKDALKAVCDDLGLGFAENESSPNDKMTWVKHNMSYFDFIKEVANHAYQDDDSFFIVYIDKYYYLNYIEVNKQLKIEDPQETFLTSSNPLAKDLNQSKKLDAQREAIEDITIMNYLTTELRFKGKSNYITELSLLSDHGKILKTQGYKRKIYYYDSVKKSKDPSENFVDFYIEPTKSLDRDQSQYLISDDENLASNLLVKKWMDILYGNTHKEWNSSRLINTHNHNELDKLKIKVKLNHINFQVSKGYAVPVYISIRYAEKLFKAGPSEAELSAKSEKLGAELPDKQLTGHYFLSGAKYHYDSLDKNGLFTELFLSRREWQPSKIIEE